MSLIGVVMPVYNGARYVGGAIQSVLDQTLTDFEFVIVDDGSTDDTARVITEFAGRDARIHLISRPNTGIVGALNDGLRESSGKYVARIDADDWCDPLRFERQVARMESEPELAVLGTCATAVDADGDRLGEFLVPLEHDEIEAEHLKGNSSIHHPSVMIRTAMLKQVGGYREGYCPAEDFDLWLRLAEVGRVANLRECLITKRLTEDGLVGTMMTRQRAIILRILSDTWKRRRLSGEPTVPERRLLHKGDLYRQWSWMALRHGARRVAGKYARKALLRQPYHPESWRAVFCAIRGR